MPASPDPGARTRAGPCTVSPDQPEFNGPGSGRTCTNALGIDVEDLDDSLSVKIAAGHRGTSDDPRLIGCLAEERPRQAGLVLGGEVDPDLDRRLR